MAISKFFSKIFSAGKAEQEQKTDVQEAPQETAKAPAVPEIDPAQLQLPGEHAVNRLWSLRCQEMPGTPMPRLSLAGLEADEVAKELPRLNLAVTSTANKRIAKTVPKDLESPVPPMDAQVVVFLPINKLSAWLLVYPPVAGGRELDQEMLRRALSENKVSFGLDEALLEALPEKMDRYFHLYKAAQGTAAVNGTDGAIEDQFSRSFEHTLTVDEYDRVDYTSLNIVQNCEKGDVICRIIAPTKGVPGRTVLNQEIPARDGRAMAPPKGRNTEINEDGTALVATLSGHVEYTSRSFQVKPVLDIPGNVDYSTGNINFLGDVHIHGDICSGFTVRAVGSIYVDGAVEAGTTVEAGGDLMVTKGVVGNNQSVVRAHRSIFAKYLESTHVYAHENLQTDCMVNCEVYCDGSVQVRSGRGIIIGGRTRAAHEVSANVVGAKSECLTSIYLGGLPCEEFERELVQQELEELEAQLEAVERKPNSPNKQSRLSQLRMKLSVSQMKLDQIDKSLEKLMAEREDGKNDLRRLTFGLAYPGTEITIGDCVRRLEQESRQSTASLLSGEICLI